MLPVGFVINLAAAKDGTTSVCRLGPEDHSLVVTGAGEELPTAAPPDRVHTGKVVVHLGEFVNLKYKTAVQLPLHLLQFITIGTWQSIFGTLESFWSLGLRIGAKLQTVTL